MRVRFGNFLSGCAILVFQMARFASLSQVQRGTRRVLDKPGGGDDVRLLQLRQVRHLVGRDGGGRVPPVHVFKRHRRPRWFNRPYRDAQQIWWYEEKSNKAQVLVS